MFKFILAVNSNDKILEGVVEEMIRYTKEIPYGYRDVALEKEYLTNTFKDKWKEKGIQQRNQEVINNMLEMGLAKEIISKATNTSIEELETKERLKKIAK